jgi:predicted nucleic acid-binding protein
MRFLVDTSVLGRLANTADALHKVASDAIEELHRQQHGLCIAPQNLVEFRNFATRAIQFNGLGMSASMAGTEIAGFEARFHLIPESPNIHQAWKVLVHAAGTLGKQVHDARIVAICQVNNIDCILTFDVVHFTPLAAHVPGLTIVHPASV